MLSLLTDFSAVCRDGICTEPISCMISFPMVIYKAVVSLFLVLNLCASACLQLLLLSAQYPEYYMLKLEWI